MINFIKAFLKSVYPQRCAYCGTIILKDKLMCSHCDKTLPRIEGEICRKCGREKKLCNCRNAAKYYEGIVAPFYFSDNVRKGIHWFKFRKCPDNAEAYSYEISETIKSRLPDVEFDFITEIPMTEKSVKQRGYNQCKLLAKAVSERLNIEYKSDVIQKIYETKKQHDLHYFLRQGNLTGVFDIGDPSLVENKTVLLCDDVSTSGETLNECAKMLWLCGAKSVYCCSVALTVSKHKTKN